MHRARQEYARLLSVPSANAHAGSRTRVTSMGDLRDAATLHAHVTDLKRLSRDVCGLRANTSQADEIRGTRTRTRTHTRAGKGKEKGRKEKERKGTPHTPHPLPAPSKDVVRPARRSPRSMGRGLGAGAHPTSE